MNPWESNLYAVSGNSDQRSEGPCLLLSDNLPYRTWYKLLKRMERHLKQESSLRGGDESG